jgi:hypothetical protein
MALNAWASSSCQGIALEAGWPRSVMEARRERSLRGLGRRACSFRATVGNGLTIASFKPLGRPVDTHHDPVLPPARRGTLLRIRVSGCTQSRLLDLDDQLRDDSTVGHNCGEIRPSVAKRRRTVNGVVHRLGPLQGRRARIWASDIVGFSRNRAVPLRAGACHPGRAAKTRSLLWPDHGNIGHFPDTLPSGSHTPQGGRFNSR